MITCLESVTCYNYVAWAMGVGVDRVFDVLVLFCIESLMHYTGPGTYCTRVQ